MCLPRTPNFSTITCSGMPDSAAISAAVIHRSGRYEAVAARPDRPHASSGLRMQRMIRSSSFQTTPGIGLPVAPEDPAHADQLAHAHQRVRRDLGVELGDLARLRRFAQRLDVAAREAVVVVAQHLGRDELGLADDPVERRMLGGEAEVGLEAEQLRLEPRRSLRRALFHRVPHAAVEVAHELVEDRLLRVEVEVEGAGGDAGDLRQLDDGRVVVAELAEDAAPPRRSAGAAC